MQCSLKGILVILSCYILLAAGVAGPCDNSPCLHGGTCVPDTEQGTSVFGCICQEGYTGNFCEHGKFKHKRISDIKTSLSVVSEYTSLITRYKLR